MVCPDAPDATNNETQNRNVRMSVLSERQVESAGDAELRGRRARNDPRYAVIPQARGAAEHERVARFEQQRLHLLAAFHSTEQEARGVAERDRDDRQAGRDRLASPVIVLMQHYASDGVVPVLYTTVPPVSEPV